MTDPSYPTYEPPAERPGHTGPGRQPLQCLVCGGERFRSEKSIEPRSGFSFRPPHKMTLLICANCDFVMQFSGHGHAR